MSSPSFMSGSFELEGWTFERFEPSNDSEDREVHIVATNGDVVHRRIVPLFHPNIFGLDVEDVAAIEEAVEALISELGLED